MNIHAYIHDNKSTMIESTKVLYGKLNKTNFAKAVLNNIREQEQEWNETVTESDEHILNVARTYYNQYIA